MVVVARQVLRRRPAVPAEAGSDRRRRERLRRRRSDGRATARVEDRPAPAARRRARRGRRAGSRRRRRARSRAKRGRARRSADRSRRRAACSGLLPEPRRVRVLHGGTPPRPPARVVRAGRRRPAPGPPRRSAQHRVPGDVVGPHGGSTTPRTRVPADGVPREREECQRTRGGGAPAPSPRTGAVVATAVGAPCASAVVDERTTAAPLARGARALRSRRRDSVIARRRPRIASTCRPPPRPASGRPAAPRRRRHRRGSDGSASSAPSRAATAATGTASLRAVRTRRATPTLGPHARTSACGWWNQIVTSGRSRSTSVRARRVSGSDHGRGPPCCGLQRRPSRRHSEPKFRFRSTPRAFCRTPRTNPSGLRFWTTRTRTPTGAPVRSRRRVTAVPAHSSPWMQPTTSTRKRAVGGPIRYSWIARPSADRPASSRSTGPGRAGRRARRLRRGGAAPAREGRERRRSGTGPRCPRPPRRPRARPDE